MKALDLLLNGMSMAGVDVKVMAQTIAGVPKYIRDYTKLRTAFKGKAEFPFGVPFPCLRDASGEAGETTGTYFHQDLLIASRVFENNPRRHLDIGSSISGFVAHVASFRKIDVIDIRPHTTSARNIRFLQADAMSELPIDLIGTTDSLSCLHALEHFGLGRYGDPICADGHIRGLENCNRLLEPGGKLYVSVPIGQQRIEFNAHRVFSAGYFLSLFSGRYTLDTFSFIDENSRFVENAGASQEDVENNYGCNRGMGIWEFTKN